MLTPYFRKEENPIQIVDSFIHCMKSHGLIDYDEGEKYYGITEEGEELLKKVEAMI